MSAAAPLNRRQMAWRAAQDVEPGSLVNLGMGMPVAVSGSQGLRPAGILRARGATRSILRGALEPLDDGAAERTSDREPGEGGWVL